MERGQIIAVTILVLIDEILLIPRIRYRAPIRHRALSVKISLQLGRGHIELRPLARPIPVVL